MSNVAIYLLRHGKTLWNEKKLYCGKTDVSLSGSGVKELKELKSLTNYPKCDKYFTSGAKRANETFKLLYENYEYRELNGFFEYDFGDFEMKNYEDLKEDKNYINWIMDEIGDVSCPNGESKKSYKNRIKDEFIRFINNLKNEKIESALLVSHGGTIGTILEEFYDNSKNFYEWQPSYGRGYSLQVEILNSEFKILNVTEI